ncbi:MAG: class I SAM-dependent methyltransferase, partial [Bacteroidia bacterium]
INKKLWNDKTKVHINSEFYNNKEFKRTKNSLNKIELDALGDLKGKSVLHLQCHFGQDTLSLQYLGAQCTGVDLSDEAIKYARELNDELKLNAEFICCDIYDLKNHLDKKFDIVFTSYGTIGWLPDMDKWADIVSHFLKPGGMFLIVDFHPVMWMFDNDFKFFQYSYFNLEPIVEELEGTYADRNAEIKNKEVGWNHNLSEVLNALLGKGLQLIEFNEYDYSNYNCFKNMVEIEKGKFQIAGLENKLPMMYSIKMVKNK